MYSVAICTYNGERFILEQLMSILNQSIPPFEIIICDDSSSDQTISIVESISLKNPQTKWTICVNPTNIGYVKNFEQAVLLSSMEIIFLADQDDVWCKNKSERILQIFNENTKCSVIFTDALIVNDKLQSTNRTMFQKIGFTQQEQNNFHKEKYQLSLLLNRSICTGATMALKKTFVKHIFPIPLSLDFIHDAWIGTMAAYLNELYFINDSLILYRQHDQQSIGTLNVEKTFLKSRVELLHNHIQRSYNREKLVYEFINQNSTLQNHTNYKFLKARVSILSCFLNHNNSFYKRLIKFSFTPFVKKIPEFNSLRKFVGNWFIYLFKLK